VACIHNWYVHSTGFLPCLTTERGVNMAYIDM
jgi:hypothetical protein